MHVSVPNILAIFLFSSVSKAALVPLVVEALFKYFKDKDNVRLTACYEDTIIEPDGTNSHTHDIAIPSQETIHTLQFLIVTV